ncbi:alpha/beta hydrolase [Arthrobacter sp. TMN-37]
MTSIPGAVAFTQDGTGEAGRTGVLLSHGFTGSPVSMRAWADHLAAQGFSVRLPLLPGHGTSWEELARTPWRAWYGEYERAYEDLAGGTDRIIAAGLSMGGALALRLAAHHDVAGVVAVNPGLTFADPRARYAGVLKYVMRSVPAIGNNIRLEGQDEGAYPRTPVAAVHQLGGLFRDTVALLPRVTAPTLIFRSDTDPVVPESSIALLEQRLGSAELEIIRLTNSYHVATMDHDAPFIFDRSADFIRHVSAGTSV